LFEAIGADLGGRGIFGGSSDNGPWGWEAASLGNLGSLDMGSSGPFTGK